MLPFPGAKSTRKEDISALLYEAIARERGESAAATSVTACRAVQELRGVASEPPTTSEVRKGLLAYLAALKFIKKNVHLSAPLDRELLWVSAFDANANCSVANLDFDYVSVLFNLGVCEAMLGVEEHRQREASSVALIRAASHFTFAASAFKNAAAVPTPGGVRNVTSDLLPEALSACEMLMLGNVQQLLYLHAKDQDSEHPLYHKINARYAAGAAHYYRAVSEKCTEPSLVNTVINGAIGIPSAALSPYFTALAEMSQAQICEKHCKMAEQLTRLINAKKACDLAESRAKEVHASTLQYLQPFKASIMSAVQELAKDLQERQAKADEENRYVYHGLEPEKNVGRIAIREAVTKDIQTVIDGVAVDARLATLENLPEGSQSELSGTSSKYAALVAKTVGNDVAALNTAASHLRETLVQAEAALATAAAGNLRRKQLPPSADSADDRKAIAAVRDARRQGGLRALRESYSKAIGFAHDARNQIRDIEAKLANEETEDRQLRAAYQTPRKESKVAAHDFHAKLTQSRTDVDKAASADGVVESQLKHHAAALQALEAVDLDGLPAAAADAAAPPAAADDVDVVVRALTSMVITAKRVLGEKDVVAQELESAKHLENPIHATARVTAGPGEAAELERLVQANYGVLRSRAQLLADRMDELTADVAAKRTALAVGGGDDARARRMAAVYRHQAAALKFEELRSFLADGVRFYAREQDALKQLAAEVDAFVKARTAEAAQVRAYATSFAAPFAPPPPNPHAPPPPPQSYAPYAAVYQQPAPPPPAQPHPPPYGMHLPYQPPPHGAFQPQPAPQQYAAQYGPPAYAPGAQPQPQNGAPPGSTPYWHGNQPPQDPR